MPEDSRDNLIGPEILEPKTAKTLGRFLEQQIIKPEDTDTALKNVENLRKTDAGKREKVYLDAIESETTFLKKMVHWLGHAEEIRLIHKNSTWDFDFPEGFPQNYDLPKEIEVGEKAQENTITLDKDLSLQLRFALSHNINGKLLPIYASSELIAASAQNDFERKEANEMDKIGKAMHGNFSEMIGSLTQGKVTLITDNQGVIKLSPLVKDQAGVTP